MPEFEEFYVKTTKWERPLCYDSKVQMTRYYIWDHHNELCLAFHNNHLIYHRGLLMGLSDGCGVPTDGGWIRIDNKKSILDFIDLKKWANVHLILCDTNISPLQRQIIEEIFSNAKKVTFDEPEKIREVYEMLDQVDFQHNRTVE